MTRCTICGGALTYRHDHKPDESGLDDGVPLPRKVVNAWKRERVMEDWKRGATLREIATRYGISHETVRAWTAGQSRTAGASRRPRGKAP